MSEEVPAGASGGGARVLTESGRPIAQVALDRGLPAETLRR